MAKYVNRLAARLAREKLAESKAWVVSKKLILETDEGDVELEKGDMVDLGATPEGDLAVKSNNAAVVVIADADLASKIADTVVSSDELSDVEFVTKDAVDTVLKYNGEEFVLIDTAGMRKKGKVFEAVEKYSLLRSLKAIDRSDICLLVLNAEEGIIEHDKHIAGYALEAGKAVVLVVNKWDTVDDKDSKMKAFKEEIRNNFQFMPYAPIVFLSALTKKRIHTFILFDDASFIFDHKTKSKFKSWFTKLRHLNCTVFACIQKSKSLSSFVTDITP